MGTARRCLHLQRCRRREASKLRKDFSNVNTQGQLHPTIKNENESKKYLYVLKEKEKWSSERKEAETHEY